MIEVRSALPIAEIATWFAHQIELYWFHDWTSKGREPYTITPSEVWKQDDPGGSSHYEIGYSNDYKVYPCGPGVFRYLDHYAAPERMAFLRAALAEWDGAEASQ